jgi:hypothetical protein
VLLNLNWECKKWAGTSHRGPLNTFAPIFFIIINHNAKKLFFIWIRSFRKDCYGRNITKQWTGVGLSPLIQNILKNTLNIKLHSHHIQCHTTSIYLRTKTKILTPSFNILENAHKNYRFILYFCSHFMLAVVLLDTLKEDISIVSFVRVWEVMARGGGRSALNIFMKI